MRLGTLLRQMGICNHLGYATCVTWAELVTWLYGKKIATLTCVSRLYIITLQGYLPMRIIKIDVRKGLGYNTI